MIDREHSRLPELEARLEDDRPVPAAAFRGDLRRHLLASGAEDVSRARARFSILAYGGSGALMLLAATAGVLGAGPFAS